MDRGVRVYNSQLGSTQKPSGLRAHGRNESALRTNLFWAAALGGALIISVVAALALQKAPAGRADIYQDGKLIKSVVLSTVSEPFSFTVTSGAGYNVITAERGRIRVSDADCPDKLCVRQGWAGGNAVPVVCLPHRLVIKFEGFGAPDVDAIVR